MDSIEFAFNNYLNRDYFIPKFESTDTHNLEEKDKFGESDLKLTVSGEHYCFMNYDKKLENKLIFAFLKHEKEYNMRKCIDHFVLKKLDDKWELHMFEFKTSVGFSTWEDVKLKFRASLLSVKALCVYLGIEINKVYAYTTYEIEKFKESQDTNPALKKTLLGSRPAPAPLKEWESGFVCLDTYDKVKLPHKAIHLNRNENDILYGEYSI